MSAAGYNSANHNGTQITGERCLMQDSRETPCGTTTKRTSVTTDINSATAVGNDHVHAAGFAATATDTGVACATRPQGKTISGHPLEDLPEGAGCSGAFCTYQAPIPLAGSAANFTLQRFILDTPAVPRFMMDALLPTQTARILLHRHDDHDIIECACDPQEAKKGTGKNTSDFDSTRGNSTAADKGNSDTIDDVDNTGNGDQPEVRRLQSTEGN